MTAKILTVIAGFVAGGVLVTGTAVAFDRSPSSTGMTAVAPMTMSGMMGATTTSATTKVFIRHVQRGCHVFSYAGRQAASLRLSLARGAGLQILNQDVDVHKLIQLAGPKVALRNYMMMGQSQSIAFKQPGVYRFKTKVLEMEGMMEVETIGPDNQLRLTVSVR